MLYIALLMQVIFGEMSFNLSQKSKSYHALDSFVYEYLNCGGVRDNLKDSTLPLEARNKKLS